MSLYTYTMPEVVSAALTELGYDCPKLVSAVVSNGNSKMKPDGSEDVSDKHTFTPEKKGKTTSKPASSMSTVTRKHKFVGSGNIVEQFAAWSKAIAAIDLKFGTLTSLGIPERIKGWLDDKFKLGAKATRNGKRNGTRRNGGLTHVNTPSPATAGAEPAKVEIGAK